MSVISSLNPSKLLSRVASDSIPKSQLGSFEINSKEFGPVTASAIGMAQALGDAGETAYSFSAESLAALGRNAESAAESVADAVGDLATTVTEGAEALVNGTVQGATQAVSAAKSAANQLVDGVEQAVDATLDTLGSVGSSVAGYATLGAAAAAHLLNAQA
jgi:hypothetical protein